MSPTATSAAPGTFGVPLRSPLPRPPHRRVAGLRLVPQRRSSAAKAPFVVVVVLLLVGGLLGLLLLNTLVAQDSFAAHDLTLSGKALQQQEQDLAAQVQALQAPADLAHRATSLGMVPGNAPAFLRLSDGRVLGQPSAGVSPVVSNIAPSVATKPITKASGKPAAQPSSSTTSSTTRSAPTAPAQKTAQKTAQKATSKPAQKPASQPAGAHR